MLALNKVGFRNIFGLEEVMVHWVWELSLDGWRSTETFILG